MMSRTLIDRARQRGYITIEDVKAWRTAFVVDEHVGEILGWLIDRYEGNKGSDPEPRDLCSDG